jgi:NAD(P)-dependent dehydrogenase (short-subunit alcohol dehydrogenase family)
VDVTDEAAVVPFINGVLTQFGALDALVNTVGGYVGGVKLWDMTARAFDQMLALNLRSGYVLAHAVMPAMLKAGHGSIVNVAAKATLDHGARHGGLRSVKGRRSRPHGFACGGCQGHGSACELYSSQHH